MDSKMDSKMDSTMDLEIKYIKLCELLTINFTEKIKLIKKSLDLKRSYCPTEINIKSSKIAPSYGAMPICGIGGGHRGPGSIV